MLMLESVMVSHANMMVAPEGRSRGEINICLMVKPATWVATGHSA
jgi:hypothetical protein